MTLLYIFFSLFFSLNLLLILNKNFIFLYMWHLSIYKLSKPIVDYYYYKVLIFNKY